MSKRSRPHSVSFLGKENLSESLIQAGSATGGHKKSQSQIKRARNHKRANNSKLLANTVAYLYVYLMKGLNWQLIR